MKASPRLFTRAVEANGKRQEFLTHFQPAELVNHDLHLFHGGTAGFGISPDGELVNLFNSSRPGLGQQLMCLAILHGATHLNCFDGYLVDYYQQFGFTDTKRVPFDERYAPDDWNYARYGRPDVVYMRLDNESEISARR